MMIQAGLSHLKLQAYNVQLSNSQGKFKEQGSKKMTHLSLDFRSDKGWPKYHKKSLWNVFDGTNIFYEANAILNEILEIWFPRQKLSAWDIFE